MEQSETATARTQEFALQLRNAVLAGDYARAQQMVEEYVQAVSPEEAADARSLLDWVKQAVSIHRNLYADQLVNLQKASGYRTSVPSPNLDVKG